MRHPLQYLDHQSSRLAKGCVEECFEVIRPVLQHAIDLPRGRHTVLINIARIRLTFATICPSLLLALACFTPGYASPEVSIGSVQTWYRTELTSAGPYRRWR